MTIKKREIRQFWWKFDYWDEKIDNFDEKFVNFDEKFVNFIGKSDNLEKIDN